ncbi:hypothetical protein [Allorhodopirellula heiligendammensis]|uniref:hypothetical protein n=1 Tax=Allorhodopirellula heiligendammensis TaxID=2714739 RepID=UPI00265E2AB4|nr:hypothetical protein [Allorhodopirellula heiligendammensis]
MRCSRAPRGSTSEHIDAKQAAEVMLDRFVRLVRHDLELIELVATPVSEGET